MKRCGIYKITNKINNKIYIGKSIDILTRWEQHLDCALSQSKDYEFYQDLLNFENFTFEILELCLESELQEKEQFYIDKYQSLFNGYNQVSALDCTKEEMKLFKDNILKAIKLLENTDLFFKEIANQTSLTINTIANINRCRSYTQYHNYKHNIRNESGHLQQFDKGELNPRSKLTEKQVLEIIELLKTTSLPMSQIGLRFNVSRSAINDINIRKNWRHLSDDFNFNIRNEYRQKSCSKGELEYNDNN